MSRGFTAIAALCLAVVLFLAVNLLAGSILTSTRIDLTQDKQHTLSAGTINTLAKLDEPVKLKFYFSAKVASGLPTISAYGQRIRDLLAEYKARAGAKLIVETIDPEPYSQEEDDAAQYGLRGLPIQSGDTLYLGLVGTNQSDGREIIPIFSLDRQNFLEYDLTRLIANLSRAKKPTIGLMSSISLSMGPGGMMAAMRGQSKPYAIYEDLSKEFDIRELPFQVEKIDPAEIQTLVMIQPPELDPASLYAIDQYVLKGGRLLVMTDPFSEVAAQASAMMGGRGGAGIPESSNLAPLFAKWGVELSDKVVADRKLAQRVTFMDKGQQRQMGYVAWLKLGEDQIDQSDIITSDLKSLNFASAGALKPTKDAKTTFKPLVTSSDDAMLVDREKLATMPDPVGLMRDFAPSGERYTLAARITGQVETAFPDGKPKKPPAEGQPPSPPDTEPQLKQSKTPINVVVIADSDFLDDKFWVQSADLFGQRVPVPTADNGNLVTGAIDNLTGSGDVISLRARPPAARSFTRVDAMRIAAEERFLAEEKRLEDQLAETERRLNELQTQGKGSADALTPAQIEEINAFQRQRAQTRIALRDVQHKLNLDIERLGTTLKILNIALVPVLLALFALGLSIWRVRRRAARIRALKAA